VEHFTQNVRIPVQALPQKKFRNRADQELVTRYFVEKFPIFLENPGDANSAVVFTYFEDSVPSLEAFKTFLNSYKQLFLGLNGELQPDLCRPDRRELFKAEAYFRSISSQEFNPAELPHYFQVRKLAEEKQFRRAWWR